MKVLIGSDHRGFSLKEKLREKFESEDIKYIDVGLKENKRDDFPKYAFFLGEKLQKKEDYIGVLICGSGGGMVIAANKVRGVRCVMCNNKKEVIRARQHDDCNVLALGAEKISSKEAFSMIKKMETKFLDGRYKKRREMIENYEENNMK